MAATAPETPSAQSEPAAAPAAKKRGGKRIKLIAIVLVLLTLPAIAAALLLPKGSASSTGEAAESGHPTEDAHSSEKSENLFEVEIGAFSVTIELEDGMLWNVSFKLFATVGVSERAHFEEAVGERYKARVRQAVTKVVRRSNINDLRDPQLDLLKRNLKTEINNVLPERYVREVIVTEIRTMQQ